MNGVLACFAVWPASRFGLLRAEEPCWQGIGREIDKVHRSFENQRLSSLQGRPSFDCSFDNEFRRNTAAGPGQGARLVCSGRRAPAGGHRPHLGLRPCAGHGHSGQGKDPDADVPVLVRPGIGPASQPPAQRRGRRVPRFPATLRRSTGRPLDAGQASQDVSHRVRGARLPDRVGVEGVSGASNRLRHRAARRP